MRTLTDLFTINGKPMFAPDEEIEVKYNDLDASDSGRDESGYMHRIVVRYKLGTWSFVYSNISEEERMYMESLFPDEPDFIFGHPSRLDPSVQEETTCYRSNYGIAWKSAGMDIWKNYKFNIIEC